MDYELTSREGVTFVRFPELNVPHGSSTRLGGVSEGEYESLNLGYTTDDDETTVDENRRRFGEALGVRVPWVLRMEHGTEVAVMNEQAERDTRLPGDACVTDRPGVTLSITTADCVPIVFYDPGRPAVGVAHAGWRGTVAGIAAATVSKMVEQYGSRATELLVGIGPAIGPERFLVDQDVADTFTRSFSGQDLVVSRGNKWAIDLWEANRRQLLEWGVPARQIFCCRLCTSSRSDLFFSYRRDSGRTGRMATAIALS